MIRSGKQGDPDMTDTVDVAAIQARTDAATPGPWGEMCMGSEGYHVYESQPSTGGPRRKLTARCTYEDWETDKANAEFIAHARTDMPTLLDLLAERDAEAARLEADLAVAVHEATTTRAALDRVREVCAPDPSRLPSVTVDGTPFPHLVRADDVLAALSSTNTTHEEQR